MAVTSTTLAAAKAANANTITVASATNFNPGQFVLVENELMQQTGPAVGTVVPVRCGLDGTVQGAHNAGAFAATGLASDFPNPLPGAAIVYGPAAPDGSNSASTTYTTAGAISPTPGVHVINGAGALAMTLAGPTGTQEGMVMIIESKNLHANTITATPAYIGAAGTGIATAAATGANLVLKASGGKWAVIGVSGIAFT